MMYHSAIVCLGSLEGICLYFDGFRYSGPPHIIM